VNTELEPRRARSSPGKELPHAHRVHQPLVVPVDPVAWAERQLASAGVAVDESIRVRRSERGVANRLSHQEDPPTRGAALALHAAGRLGPEAMVGVRHAVKRRLPALEASLVAEEVGEHVGETKDALCVDLVALSPEGPGRRVLAST